jgi:amino acid adenylation domain-containing protein/non-ribosomal peptide synthase protein (TIGR01720 family)
MDLTTLEKSELLDYLLEQEGIESPRPQVIRRRGNLDELPLSFAQERLWFLYQLEPESACYNEPAAVHLAGMLNAVALEQGINEIVRRHQVLRTVFTSVEGQPVQVTLDTIDVRMPLVDLQQVPKDERNSRIRELAQAEYQQPFDLVQGPLIRVRLLRLAQEEHVLLLTMHHSVSDGWSVGVFFNELAALYEAFCLGKPSPLPQLPIQYVDYAHWQRNRFREESLDKPLAYWKKQLGGSIPILEFPSDRPRPPIQTFRGARLYFSLPASLSEAITGLSRRENVTLFMVLVGAFQTFLYRCTGQDDVLIGSPIAGRNWPEVEKLIGCFLNTLVLRTDLSGNPSFRELLARVRDVAMGAYTYQDVPFERLVEELHPERDISRNPLFQIMFVLQNSLTLELPGLSVTPAHLDRGAVPLDLILSMEQTAQGLGGWWEYNTDLFDDKTIARHAGHFQTMLEGVVANCDQRLSDLPLLSQDEEHQLLVEWNETRVDYPNDACLHHLFEAQVKRTPDTVSVVFENEKLTYRELNRRGNQLAHHLQKLGVGPDVLVGICVERSLEMVIGLLGVLKAGGAYVPLDPEYPTERLAFMIEDCRAPVLLAQQRLVDGLPEHGARVICLDADWEEIAQESQNDPVSEAKSHNLAYVIYTSGSTGQPKGVMISHRAICNHMFWIQDEFPLAGDDRVVQKTPFSFDASVWEFYAPLIAGAQLIMARPEGHRDCAYLIDLIARQQVTILQLVPSLLQLLLDEPEIESCKSLRRVFCGGEALSPELVKRFYERLAVDLQNLYGPTEAAIDATFWTCRREGEQRSVPIGRPISNMQTYLLDSHLKPVPIGVPGELYIGGAGLARGYWNRLELTREKFIRNPFNSEAGACLYKTGDMARYRSDGALEFLGRIDHQVKLRGFRMELGEIEVALSEHPRIHKSVVMVREDNPGDKRLVAYLVAHAEPPEISEVRAFLKEKLPDFMVPAVLVLLDSLPLTPNGKVDRQALPAPDQTRPDLKEDFVAPRTLREEVLAGIWAEILRVEQVGVHDNFFELGGDSILSIQIIARANRAGIRLSPRQIFQHQTIAELAAVASTTSVLQSEQGVVSGPLPLTPIQHWFFEQNFADPHHWNMAVLLEAKQAVNVSLLENAVGYLLAHHDALRLRFNRVDSVWQQVNSIFDGAVPFTQVDLSRLSETEQRSAMKATAADLHASLDLAAGPLLRVAFFDLGVDRPSWLLLTVHHLAVDGVSWRILLEDLDTAYGQLSRGEAINLPPKTASYKHWAQQLAGQAKTETVREELPYWVACRRIGSSRLSVDRVNGANTVASAEVVSVSLGIEETRTLLQEVPKAYNTQINDALLTALVQAFSRWTGQTSLLIDLEGHGREEIFEAVDLSRTVGWFTTVFPVLLDLSSSSNTGDALKSIKECLRRLPNRGIGYGLLRYLDGDAAVGEQLSALPQPEIIFNYLGQCDQVLQHSSWFKLTRELSGPVRSPRGTRRYLLEVDAFVIGGRLYADWMYSESFHRRATVESVAQGFVQALRSIIIHCQSPEAVGFTPSDFPDIDMSQEELDRFIESIEQM